ncbi:MAG: threonine/serine exporter family protein, partial [Thermoanaerobaculia bacterium]
VGDESVVLLVRLGRALHEAGLPAPQLEGALRRVAERLAVPAQFFSTPTSLLFGFGEGLGQRTHLERVEPAGIDLGRLTELEAIADRIADGELDVAAAQAALDGAADRAPRYRRGVSLLAWALSSATSAIFLGGGWAEVAVAALIGLAIGLLASGLERREQPGQLFEPVAAGLAAFIAASASQLWMPHSVYIATLAGLIYLIPGFRLTLAMIELATQHLSSGVARFSGALVVFLTITFGTALGSRFAELIFGPPLEVPPAPVGGWIELAALLVAPVALAILFRAPLSAAPAMVAIGFLGYQGGRLGSEWISPELGMFAGALAAGLAARAWSRWSGKPETVVLGPAILLLVPGSIGYRSFASLLERDIALGVETAFRMVLVAVSLVAGLLLAHAVVRPRRAVRPRIA